MVKVTRTQDHVRRASYKFFADPRGGGYPIFIRRTAANQPPTQHPQSKEVRWLRDRFAWANYVWSTFTSDQRSFYRQIAVEVTTSFPAGRVESRLLSGQELFIAMMMKIRSYGQYKGLVPQKWELYAKDLCGNIFEDTVITVWSKSLKRTVVRQTADEYGLFQWISLAPWALPFQITIKTKCLGTIVRQFTTMTEFMHFTGEAILHPIKVYNTHTGEWTLPDDPVWVRRSCSGGNKSMYQFNTVERVLPGMTGHWREPIVQILPGPDCSYFLRAGSYYVPGVNQIWWHNNHIMDVNEWAWPIFSTYVKIYGPTGEIMEWP